MIGKIYISTTEYFDSSSDTTKFKARPILVIGNIKNNDYTVLPISTISKKENIDSHYDIKIDPLSYPKVKLNKISYIRTHKKTPLHRASINFHKLIGDLKQDYENLFLNILEKVQEFDNEIIDNSLS